MDGARIESVPGWCALCRSRCGARFQVADGRLVGVAPWAGHPTGGSLCAKGRAAPELQYHPERLSRPLRRTTPRGHPDPRWEPVGWDEALDGIAARLRAIRDESGAHAVAFASASPGATALSDSLEWIERLVFAFGSPNFLTGVENCNWHRDHNHAHTFGTGIGMPDYEHTDLVLLWGFNPGNVWLAQAQALARARARGARLVVIDPVRTRHAAQADRWLPVRPGTDAALALGLARELIAQAGFDQAFVRAWSNAPWLIRDDTGQPLRWRDIEPAAANGDDPVAWHAGQAAPVPVDTRQAMPAGLAAALALEGVFHVGTAAGPRACRTAFTHYRAACEPWTPEAVQAHTGVPAGQVRELAGWIAASRAVSYFSWTGIAQHSQATQTDRAIALLYALTGCTDAPGGNRQLARLPARAAADRGLLPPGQAARALGLAERPLGPPAFGWALGADFHRAVLRGEPYRVRALVGFGANLLLSQPDTAAMDEALRALEFQVHVDLFESPTARHADYLLPACTPWEREGLRIGFEISEAAQQWVQWRPRAVAPAPESQARPDLEIVFDLAVRLGLGEHFMGGSVERGWDHQLAPLGLDIAALRARPEGVRVPLAQGHRAYQALLPDGRVRGFPTPSGRVEFHSAALAAAGQPPVPVAAPRPAEPGFPLTLGCAKSGYYCQSQHRGAASLRAREPEPHARLHPALAAARGIAPGDRFEVLTPHGRARFTARLDADLHPDTVLASFGWWQGCADLGLEATNPLAPDGGHMNTLVGFERLDAAAGSAPLRSQPCEVRSLPGPARWAGWRELRLRRVAREAEGVLALSLARADGEPLPDFRPGQFVRLAFELPGLGRQERCYSFTGAACAGGHAAWSIAVGRAPGAGVSDALHRWFEARPDGVLTVEAMAPAGRFLLPLAPVRPTAMVAVGVGITPFLSMLETMAARVDAGHPAPAVPLRLVRGNRDPAHRAFAARVEALKARLPTLTVVDRFSRAPHGAGALPGRAGAHDVPDDWLRADARVYLCGPPAFVASTRQALLARGGFRHAVFAETFETPPPPAADDGAAAGHEVFFVRSGRRARWQAGDGSLLALAERLGVPIAGGCRIGQCESCRVPVRAGQVFHRAETDVAQEGDCLACIAVPRTALEIDA